MIVAPRQSIVSCRANNYRGAPIYYYDGRRSIIMMTGRANRYVYKSAPRHALVRDYRYNDIELYLYTNTFIYIIGALVVLVALIGNPYLPY